MWPNQSHRRVGDVMPCGMAKVALYAELTRLAVVVPPGAVVGSVDPVPPVGGRGMRVPPGV